MLIKNKMKIVKIIKVVVFTMLFTFPLCVSADDLNDAGNGNGDVQDVPAAPISDYTPLLVCGAVVLGFALLTQKKVRV